MQEARGSRAYPAGMRSETHSLRSRSLRFWSGSSGGGVPPPHRREAPALRRRGAALQRPEAVATMPRVRPSRTRRASPRRVSRRYAGSSRGRCRTGAPGGSRRRRSRDAVLRRGRPARRRSRRFGARGPSRVCAPCRMARRASSTLDMQQTLIRVFMGGGIVDEARGEGRTRLCGAGTPACASPKATLSFAELNCGVSRHAQTGVSAPHAGAATSLRSPSRSASREALRRVRPSARNQACSGESRRS